jgi:hypothetical protein
MQSLLWQGIAIRRISDKIGLRVGSLLLWE